MLKGLLTDARKQFESVSCLPLEFVSALAGRLSFLEDIFKNGKVMFHILSISQVLFPLQVIFCF